MATIQREYTCDLKADKKLRGDRLLARSITLAESGTPAAGASSKLGPRPSRSDGATGSGPSPRRAFVVGVAGPGGAGKSTLIDELTSRFLTHFPSRRMAILANDPSHPGSHGAILGDRVSAIYAQDDRVFFRSLATRGNLTGVSAVAPAAIEVLRQSGEFDLIFVESVGIGQDSDPFDTFHERGKLVDAVLFVLAPHYGGQIQLQKIGLLNGADLVALNKCDDPRASTAKTEVQARLGANGKNQRLHMTVAAQHNDAGVDDLFSALVELADLPTSTGGEKACQLQITD